MDYVATLRRSCGPDSPFTWPSESMAFEQAITVAAHHLTPGHCMCIQNDRPIPQNITGRKQQQQQQQQSPPQEQPQSETSGAAGSSGGGRLMSEAAVGSRSGVGPPPPMFDLSEPFFDWRDAWKEDPHDKGPAPDVPVFYHGTSAHNLPYIMAEGFRPGLGAGADRVMYHYGVPVPGVYVSPSWRTAATYPMTETTGEVTIDGIRQDKASQEAP